MGTTKTPPRQTSSRISTIASRTLSGDLSPSEAQVKAMAASLLSQDQTKGQKPKAR